MRLKDMFKKPASTVSHQQRAEAPEGILRKCKKCGSAVFSDEIADNYEVCPKCGGYFRVTARRRLEMVVDEGSFEEWDTDLKTTNPLDFRGYEEHLAKLQEKTQMDEAVLTGKAAIRGKETVIAVMDSNFFMASMGHVVGEKITRAVERATSEKLPVIIFTCSGGARMQEGLMSLMQMEKTSAALKHHSEAGLLYISVLTDPTTGGVTASFAMLGDIILAEPGALIGFAGPRVIEQTIGQKLPKGFQRSEFLLKHGFVDAIVERRKLRRTLAYILAMHKKHRRKVDTELLYDTPEGKKNDIRKASAWERVERSRRSDRPVGEDYIHGLFTDFLEFHGDRTGMDDTAIMGGIARFHGIPVTVIAQSKGHNTKENVARNFGMPSPEGYRKALRLIKQAERFHRPVIMFVDTPGAFCGMEAEEHGQGEAIARNLFELVDVKTPLLSIVIGEGGSGGALAMAVADEVWMLENSVYSILSPEGYASILWKDSKRAKEAAKVMKMTATDVKRMGFVEKVFAEPDEYTVQTMSSVLEPLDRAMYQFITEKAQIEEKELTEARYRRFRQW